MPFTIKNVLISDAVDQSCVDLLKAHNINVTCKYKLPKEELIKELSKHDGLIVRSDTKVTADVLQSCKGLRVIGRAGTGVDNIDIPAATRKGVIVLNTPGGNSISACELTCSLITAMARHIAQGCQSLKEGRWDRKLYTGSELSGKTLAVLGLGRIGREVAARMQAFGMKTIGFDPMVSAEDAAAFNVEKRDLDQIWPEADYITIHTPLIPQTRNLINSEVLSKCKRGVRIVNVARGGIVDEAALLEALKDGRCGGAALDVFVEEPPRNPTSLALIQHPRVVCTPHLGASTDEAQTRVAVEIAEQFIALNDPKSPYKITGAVNAPVLSAACVPYNNKWIELTTSLGRLLGKLLQDEDRADAKVELIRKGSALENMGFLGTAALVGLLTGRTSNGLNLINAPQLAQEAGLVVSQRYEPSEQKSVTVSVATAKGTNSVTGTIKSKTIHYLLAVNGAQFSQVGRLVGTSTADWNSVQLFSGANPRQDFLAISEALSAKGVDVVNYSAASGEQSQNFYVFGLSSPLEAKLEVPNVRVY
ncbi:hydroxypyruvate reductase-like [Macrosteles quadrilineatus]|uniref:hydroxypyruvate reductase-like n=1 Tax=Macrosteles quadrilineatus TaxID=74068 RepID=UPI0023E2ADFA|nr:hydroxypyruvate reductase-like [Macrosteles quadrilineatus]